MDFSRGETYQLCEDDYEMAGKFKFKILPGIGQFYDKFVASSQLLNRSYVQLCPSSLVRSLIRTNFGVNEKGNIDLLFKVTELKLFSSN